MPTAPIDDKGNYVYYEDSGINDSDRNYTTIILVHGYSINGAIFRRMLPCARDHGIRIFTMNMRDYRDSSSYSEEELAQLSSTNIDSQVSAVRQFGRDIAGFVAYICTTKDIPRIVRKGDGTTGGVVLMTWSMSNLASLSILGDEETLVGESKSTLHLYLRKVILYDCPSIVFGIYPDIGMHFPLRSAEIPMEQKPAAFAQWVSSYYQPLSNDLPITPENLHGCYVQAQRPPTMTCLSLEEYKRAFDPDVLTRSGRLLTFADEVYRRIWRRTFLNADAVLPEVEIVALWCDSSVWLCLWAVKALKDLQEEESAGGRRRPFVVRKLENANHFLHWDEPERLIRVIEGVL